MTVGQRVEQSRVRLHRLETDCRLLPCEIERARLEVLGVGVLRPTTLGQANRYIEALGAMLTRVTAEIPF